MTSAREQLFCCKGGEHADDSDASGKPHGVEHPSLLLRLQKYQSKSIVPATKKNILSPSEINKSRLIAAVGWSGFGVPGHGGASLSGAPPARDCRLDIRINFLDHFE
jgi:hypothetical protein